jgi:hypothetical protein
LSSIMLILWVEETLVLVITRRVDVRNLRSGLGFVQTYIMYIIVQKRTIELTNMFTWPPTHSLEYYSMDEA